MTLDLRDGRKRKNFRSLFTHQEDARRQFNQVSFSLRVHEF